MQESGAVDSATAISVTCPAATAYSISLSGLAGGQRFLSNGVNNLEYQIYSDAARTTVWGATVPTDTVAGTGTGSAVSTNVYGRVFDNAGNRAVPAGAYNAVVTVTVAY